MKMRIRFTKLDEMKFISHLDLASLFERAFRRSQIKLVFSQGFNPHPKMSFAHPLSLGISSSSEYLDIEMENDLTGEACLEQVKDAFPEGIEILGCQQLHPKEKSIMTFVEYGEYSIESLMEEKFDEAFIKQKIEAFLEQEEIIYVKKLKKSRKRNFRNINIREMIYDFKLVNRHEQYYAFHAILSTSNDQSLKPAVLMSKFFAFIEAEDRSEQLKIHRKDLFVLKDNRLLSISDLD